MTRRTLTATPPVRIQAWKFRCRQYMAFIAPFRHWVVYPALLRQIERAWSTGGPR